MDLSQCLFLGYGSCVIYHSVCLGFRQLVDVSQHMPWGLVSWWIYHTAYSLGIRKLVDLSQRIPWVLGSLYIYHTAYALGLGSWWIYHTANPKGV